ncbi:MAG: HlyD family efflux transporter periplasmic adaptor subunit [Pseudomonadota bacterium]
MQRKTKRILLVLSIFVGSIVAFMGLMATSGEPPKFDVEEPALLVDTITLESTAASFQVRSQGTVRPRTQTELSAEISGAIVSISPKFVAGGVFQKGEVLIRIDSTDYAAAVKQAEALLVQRQIEHAGALKLKEQGYRAEAEVASASAALATAEADVVRAKRNLDRTIIRLPYEGMVLAKHADLGQFVAPGTKLGTTFATDYAEIRLPLTDQDLAFVEIPDSKEVTASGGADGPEVTLTAVQRGKLTSWAAQIVRSEGVVDERSRVTYAVARLADPYRLHSDGTPLPIGTFVAASIDGVDAGNVVRVSRNTMVGSDRLMIVSDESTLEIRTVEVLRTDADFAYLNSAELIGERIVVSKVSVPVEGIAVRTIGDGQENLATSSGDSEALTTVTGEE